MLQPKNSCKADLAILHFVKLQKLLLGVQVSHLAASVRLLSPLLLVLVFLVLLGLAARRWGLA